MTAFWSLNEIEALARKAARGAGYDWGLAEEAGQAVRWLVARDFRGADALMAALNAGAPSERSDCSLATGCALSDGLVGAVGYSATDVISPLLVLPFVAWAAERQRTSMCLTWEGAEFLVGMDGALTWRAQTVCPDRADIAVTGAASGPLARAIEGHRALVDCETFAALSDFAARTYAPSTEASRESGAGAGLTDND